MKITLKDTGLQSSYRKDFDATFAVSFGHWVNVAAYYSDTAGLPARFYLRDQLGAVKEIARLEFADYVRIYLDQTLWRTQLA